MPNQETLLTAARHEAERAATGARIVCGMLAGVSGDAEPDAQKLEYVLEAAKDQRRRVDLMEEAYEGLQRAMNQLRRAMDDHNMAMHKATFMAEIRKARAASAAKA